VTARQKKVKKIEKKEECESERTADKMVCLEWRDGKPARLEVVKYELYFCPRFESSILRHSGI
jgi:hypothetical protein